MNVSGRTNITGIFGYPVQHTLSPLMHNAAFESLKLDNCYIPFMVRPEDLPQAVASIRALNLLGVNITVPHKEKVIPLLDRVDEEATFIGAVNTITNSAGVLTGYNTDGRGFMSSLSEKDIHVDGKKVAVVGAGGASRAICYYLSEKAAHLSLFDINGSKLNTLASDLAKIRSNVTVLDSVDNLGSFDIIVNATPLGLKKDDPLPFSAGMLCPDKTVCDLVYRTTPLLIEAEKRGARCIDGSGMLLWQGVLAFELWTKVRPPVDLMRSVLLSAIEK